MDKSQTITELEKLVKQQFNGLFPTFSDLKKSYPSLTWYIEKHGGYLHLKKCLGCNIQERKSPNYWNNWDNLKSNIQPLIINNKFPTVLQIKTTLGNGAYKSVLKFGGIVEVAIKLGCSIDSMLITSDGHHVQSSYEYIVDEFLYANKIPHEVGGIIHSSKNYRFDFKVENWYIEIWGYDEKNSRGKKYNEKRARKESLYQKMNLNLISIEASLFSKTATEIELFLKNIIEKLGISPLPPSEFDIKNCLHHTRFWNYENTLTEINNLISKNGYFPSWKDIGEKRGLIHGVSKHGGLQKFRKLFGYEPSKPSWNKESVVNELIKISKHLQHFPTCTELKSMNKTGLLDAIQNLGGINLFRTEMGYSILKKHKRS